MRFRSTCLFQFKLFLHLSCILLCVMDFTWNCFLESLKWAVFIINWSVAFNWSPYTDLSEVRSIDINNFHLRSFESYDFKMLQRQLHVQWTKHQRVIDWFWRDRLFSKKEMVKIGVWGGVGGGRGEVWNFMLGQRWCFPFKLKHTEFCASRMAHEQSISLLAICLSSNCV